MLMLCLFQICAAVSHCEHNCSARFEDSVLLAVNVFIIHELDKNHSERDYNNIFSLCLYCNNIFSLCRILSYSENNFKTLWFIVRHLIAILF